MHQIECHSYGPPESLQWCERPSPEPGAGQIRVDVHAAGVNFVDALFVSGEYQVKLPTPFVPGNELAGRVSAVGAGATDIAVGDAVMAQSGAGAFAEQVVIDADVTTRIPGTVDMATAAAFQLTYATALYALRERGQLAAGETVLVLAGAGGVGSAAIDVARHMGARVIAATGSPEKFAACQRLGAETVIDYSAEDLKARVRELTAGRGADLVIDPVGGPYAEPAVRATARNGRYLVIGFAAGEIPRIPLNLVLLRSCQIVGVDYGAVMRNHPAEAIPVQETLAAWLAAGEISPLVTDRWPLAQAGAALRAVMDRKVIGKAVLEPEL